MITNPGDAVGLTAELADKLLVEGTKIPVQKEVYEASLNERARSSEEFGKALSDPINSGVKLYLKFAKNKNLYKALETALAPVSNAIKHHAGNSDIVLAKDYLKIVDKINEMPSKDIKGLFKGNVANNIVNRSKRNTHMADGNSSKVHSILNDIDNFIEKYPLNNTKHLTQSVDEARELLNKKGQKILG